MDDQETANRRARLRELIVECFGGRSIDLLEHIRRRTGIEANQGEISAIQKDHGGKSFGDKKAKVLTEQIGLHRRWFDWPVGTHTRPDEWMAPVGESELIGSGADDSRSADGALISSEKFDQIAHTPLNAGASLMRPNVSRFTTSVRSPAPVYDWAELGRSDVSSLHQGDEFDALVAPGPFPATLAMTRAQGRWMEPDIKPGDLIWVDRSVAPQNEDIVIAQNTANGRTIMGEYQDGFAGGFLVVPRKGQQVNSIDHPISVLAVVMCHLRVQDAMQRREVA